MTTVLGAILAGGQGRRFGSNKALATAFGKPLIEHAIDSISATAPDLVVCGRNWPGYVSLADRPSAGMGPLAGLAAALHHARVRGISWVLSLACDTPFVEPEILDELVRRGQPRFLADHPVIGLWPSDAADH